ncbi:MAG: SPOR domain-containing protein [Betaproteobacteria bacterium]|nr:SPOR domain-containing protein [Betaproteobacteria bacterium]
MKAQTEHTDLKRKLVWRMGFASLMIVTLLGTLVLFDYLSSHDDPDEQNPETGRPAPVARKEVTQPVKIAEQALEVGKEIKVAAEPESSAAPVDKSSPLAGSPPRPQVSAQPRVDAKADASTAPGPGARMPQRGDAKTAPLSRPALPPAAPPPGPAAPAASAKAAAQPQPAPPMPPVRAEDYPEVARPPPSPPRLFSGFALQAGVFSDLRRAEELHAKLTLHGIPSTFEARVNVGPFKTREEADTVREKMKALGIDSVMLLPKGIRR